MQQWSDEEAQKYCQQYAAYGEDLALRVYTTRLLGRDPSLVLHGGGNTSVKTRMRDELDREVAVLRVKGSGWDMGDIEPQGLPAVCLQPLGELRNLPELSDEAMVNFVRRCLLDTSAPNPSVETLLHAFLPHKFVDHTHADAVLALANQPNAAALCRKIFGEKMGIVPYIMPGFELAKACAAVYEEDPAVEGLILIHHGIFTFGETARQSYQRMIDQVGVAQNWLATHSKDPTPRLLQAQSLAKSSAHAMALATLRGCLNTHPEGIGHQLLHWRHTTQITAFLERSDLAEICSRGTATPDHVIRTKKRPLLLELDMLEDRNYLNQAIADYVKDYQRYFDQQTKTKGLRKRLNPLPIVFLIPGLGLVTAGKTMSQAAIAADIYEHTIDVISDAEAVGQFQPLPEDQLFDMEYWSLEQAKLGKKQTPPLAGKVALITGAAGGIGQAVSRCFAAQGAALILSDLDAAALQQTADTLSAEGFQATALAGDITDPTFVTNLVQQGCTHMGGIDILISNAGSASCEPILQASDALQRSLKINLMSHQYLAAAVTHVLLAQQSGGCLLFNASKSAFNPGPDFGAYAVAKAGLVALMKQYALEHAAQGIRASAINADRVRTKLFHPELLAQRAAARGLDAEAYFRANLLGEEVLAEDVAKAFLALYHARKSTGLVMTVDGGNVAASPR